LPAPDPTKPAALPVPLLTLGALLLALLWQWNAWHQNQAFLAINALGNLLSRAFWQSATQLGDTVVLLCLLSGLLAWRPTAVLNLVASIPLGALLTVVVKHGFSSLRPGEVLDPTLVQGMLGNLSGNSFPSGHTLTAFAAACSFWAVAYHAPNDQQARLLWRLAYALALVIALSRVMLGVHWPIDLLGGASLGWVSGLSGAWLVSRKPSLTESHQVLWGLSGVLCLAALYLGHRALNEADGPKLMLWLAATMPWVNAYALASQKRATGVIPTSA
jgi:undecaprenyl-diphosphatase